MSGCQFNVEEIFSRLFTQERYYNATHIPHFLQTFAPPRVQKLSRDVQTLALLQGATLLASVAPNPVPLFDLPPLPNSEDSRASKPGDHFQSPNPSFIAPSGQSAFTAGVLEGAPGITKATVVSESASAAKTTQAFKVTGSVTSLENTGTPESAGDIGARAEQSAPSGQPISLTQSAQSAQSGQSEQSALVAAQGTALSQSVPADSVSFTNSSATAHVCYNASNGVSQALGDTSHSAQAAQPNESESHTVHTSTAQANASQTKEIAQSQAHVTQAPVVQDSVVQGNEAQASGDKTQSVKPVQSVQADQAIKPETYATASAGTNQAGDSAQPSGKFSTLNAVSNAAVASNAANTKANATSDGLNSSSAGNAGCDHVANTSQAANVKAANGQEQDAVALSCVGRDTVERREHECSIGGSFGSSLGGGVTTNPTEAYPAYAASYSSGGNTSTLPSTSVKIQVHQGLNAELKAQHCQVVTSCPFASRQPGENEFHCKFFVDNSCTCAQAWAISADQNMCVEAVFPGVSKKVWTTAEFEDVRAAVRYSLDEDRVQITLCEPLRHLQHKTQLFPLDVKASVRSRLTHCYEVALYSKLSISALIERMPMLRPLLYESMVCVENAALLHDIGRPPVGKFGEEILRQWIKDVCELYDHELTSAQQEDLKAFNGHAQGLRLAHAIYKLNLSLCQLSTIMKAPATYDELRKSGLNEESARKAAGIFASELDLRDRIRKSGLTTKRHPLSWLLEQCDDLAYILGDLDDAYDRGLLKDSEILELIESLIAYLKDNACNSTCDQCISACTCANGYVYPYCHSNEEFDEVISHQSNSDSAHASIHGHSYGYGVEPAERDKLHSVQNIRIKHMNDTLNSVHDASSSTVFGNKVEAQNQVVSGSGSASSGTTNGGSKYGGRQVGSKTSKFVLGGEHCDVLADGLTFNKLDLVIVDAIKHSYCQGKQDSFGVLQLVHGTNPISLSKMMKELGVRNLLALIRECIVTYYIDDVINAICANQYDFFFNGELNVTHYGNDAHKAIDYLKRFEQQMVYCHEDVESIELSGGKYLKYVLDEYAKMLSVSSSEFISCMTKHEGDPLVQRLCHRLPKRCKEAYLETCKKDMNIERYSRIRLIIDSISCMTDPFLASEYETLSGNTCRHIL